MSDEPGRETEGRPADAGEDSLARAIAGLGVGILPILALYYLIFRAPVPADHRPAFLAGFVMLCIQLLGYYAAYLVSPYELEWHLSYSSTRILLQLFPLLLFLTLCAAPEAENSTSSSPTRNCTACRST